MCLDKGSTCAAIKAGLRWDSKSITTTTKKTYWESQGQNPIKCRTLGIRCVHLRVLDIKMLNKPWPKWLMQRAAMTVFCFFFLLLCFFSISLCVSVSSPLPPFLSLSLPLFKRERKSGLIPVSCCVWIFVYIIDWNVPIHRFWVQCFTNKRLWVSILR